MEYSLIRLKYAPRYASLIDPNGQRRYISFSSRETAQQCIQQISRYRSDFGTWPSVDFTQQLCVVKKREVNKKRKQKDIEKFFVIDTYDYQRFDELARSYNAQFFYCHGFELCHPNNQTCQIHMRGQEVFVPEDYDNFRNMLEIGLSQK